MKETRFRDSWRFYFLFHFFFRSAFCKRSWNSLKRNKHETQIFSNHFIVHKMVQWTVYYYLFFFLFLKWNSTRCWRCYDGVSTKQEKAMEKVKQKWSFVCCCSIFRSRELNCSVWASTVNGSERHWSTFFLHLK